MTDTSEPVEGKREGDESLGDGKDKRIGLQAGEEGGDRSRADQRSSSSSPES